MLRFAWIAVVLGLGLVACHGERGERAAPPGTAPRGDASTPPTPAEPTDAGPLPDAATSDAGAPRGDDAGAGPSKLTVHPRRGAPDDDAITPRGSALVLDSGAPQASVFGWMCDALFSPGLHGDLVVLNASSGDSAPSLLAAARFRSVQTLSLGDGATSADFAAAAAIVARAEAIWFEGGDQARYVRWKDSALLAAVQETYARGGAVGGSSAGMIILGEAVNDALLTLSENLTTARLLRDPFDPELHFTRELLRFEPLRSTITDPHFSTQNRMGRLATFMARQVEAAAGFRGIAVDDGVALAIDATGVGRRLGADGGGSVTVVRGGRPTQMRAGQPLRYEGLQVRRLDRAAHRYDLRRDCGYALDFRLEIDGALDAPYSVDPYTSGTAIDDCPTDP